MRRLLATVLFFTFFFSPMVYAQDGTKRLFYMVSPNFYEGPDVPSDAEIAGQRDLFDLIRATEGKVFVLATFTLTGAEGSFLTTAIAYTKDYEGIRGWNVVIRGLPMTMDRERMFFGVENGEMANMVLSGALYMVGLEIPIESIDETLDHDGVDALFNTSLEYLQSLL
jgi:hypothetical protein